MERFVAPLIRTLAVGLVFAATNIVADQSADYDFARLVDIGGGRKMYLECRGAGSPTVMLISGKGNDAADWNEILDPVDPIHTAPVDLLVGNAWHRGRRLRDEGSTYPGGVAFAILATPLKGLLMPLLRCFLFLPITLLFGTSILEAAPAPERPIAASLLTSAKVKCKTIKGNRTCRDVGEKKSDGEKKKSKAAKAKNKGESATTKATESSAPPAQKLDPQEYQNKVQEAEGRFSVGTDAVEASKENK